MGKNRISEKARLASGSPQPGRITCQNRPPSRPPRKETTRHVPAPTPRRPYSTPENRRTLELNPTPMSESPKGEKGSSWNDSAKGKAWEKGERKEKREKRGILAKNGHQKEDGETPHGQLKTTGIHQHGGCKEEPYVFTN